MRFIDKVKIVLFQPTSFFSHLKKEQGVKTAFKYFAVISFIGTVLGLIISPIYTPFFTFLMKLFGDQIAMPTFGQQIVTNLINFILGLGISFVCAGILHIWIKIFGGRVPYAKTYQLFTYSSTPGYLLGWIPVLGLFSVIYNLVLLIIGTQQVHGLSKKKVLLMYLIPLALFLILLAVLAIVGFYIFSKLSSLPVA